MGIPEKLLNILVKIQKNEINEYYVYSSLSQRIEDPKNSQVLLRIAKEEFSHANFWKKYTGVMPKPSRMTITFYKLISLLFGLTFSLKLMEKAEQNAQNFYIEICKVIPEAQHIIEEEDWHEKELIDMIEEDKLKYAGAIVLGLNDALVELTGALAGLTFALQNSFIIGVVGTVTGISASFSMSASSYLSAKSEGVNKNYTKSAFYTGLTYIFTVFFLVLPYFLIGNAFFALITTICIAFFIIFLFNFYISVAKDLSFKSRFLEMVALNIIVTFITFLIGYGLRRIFDLEI